MISKLELDILNQIGNGISFKDLALKTGTSYGNLSKKIKDMQYYGIIDNRHKTKYNKFIKLTKSGKSLKDFYGKHNRIKRNKRI